jgi:TPR repeat protein
MPRWALAAKYLDGRGVPKDYDQARQLCRKALEQSDYRADYCLGVIYDHGPGVKRDAKEARKWYERAAAKGQIQATKSLANMDVTGDGGKVDRIQAFLLYARLAEAGDQDALQSLIKLRKEITSKEWVNLRKPLIQLRIDPSKLDSVLKQSDPK